MPRDSVEKRAAQETKVYGDAVIVACGGLSYPSTGSTGTDTGLPGRRAHGDGAVAGPGAVCGEGTCGEGAAGPFLKNIEAAVMRGKR